MNIDEASICRSTPSPLGTSWTVAEARSERQAADQLMLMMQDMAGISANESAWIRAKHREGLRSNHEQHAASSPSARHASTRSGVDSLLHSIGVDEGDASVRVAANLEAADTQALESEALLQGTFEGLFVKVLPGGTASSPVEADRHYRVAAIDVDIFYNRFGGHDPHGKVFVLEQHREMVLRGSKSFNGGHDPLFYGQGYQGDLPLVEPETGQPVTGDDAGPVIPVEPLVLRANRGETVVIDFTNRLTDAEPANLMVNGAAYDTSDLGDGNQAPLPDPDIEDGYQLRYVITVGDGEASEGTYYFRSRPIDFADISEGLKTTTEQIRHGLFGALIIEPPDAIYLDPSAFALQEGSEDGSGGYVVDPYTYQEIEGSWSAIIASASNAFPAFREHVIFFHDDLQGSTEDPIIEGLIEKDPKAIGYRTEPFADIFSPEGRPRTGMNQPFAVNDRSMAYSAYTYGDSSTPHPRFYVGDPMRYRVIHAGVGNEFHVFHHHAHRWRTQSRVIEADGQTANLTAPSKWGRPEFPNQPDVTASTSNRIDSQTLGPAEAFDVFMEGGAGGVQRTVGDTLLHCHIIQHVTEGMWTYARIYNTLQQPTPQMPGLAPLPDRLGDAVQPPIAVDSTTLAEMVEDGAGPTPLGGPLSGEPISDVDNQLLPFLDAQLPTAGVPDPDKIADGGDSVEINYADKWDWMTIDDSGKQLYLGAPWDFGEDSFVKFGVGFPTVGEGVGAERDDAMSDGTPLERPKLLFNPRDGRLAYPHLMPQAGQRPPFAPRKTLVCNENGAGEKHCSVQSSDEGQGTAYLGPVLGLDDPGRDADGEAVGVATGSGLAPEEAAGDPDNVRHYDIIALQLPVDYATHSGAEIDGEFGNADQGQADNLAREPQIIEIIGGESPGDWTINVGGDTSLNADIIVVPGDTIIWSVERSRHGVTFPEWTEAQDFLEFDDVGVPFDDQDEEKFGPRNMGTDAHTVPSGEEPFILAQAKVRDRADQGDLDFVCTFHGPNAMRGRLCFGECSPKTVDQNAQLFVLADDVPDIMTGRKRAEPLVIRANTGDVIDITLRSALPDQASNNNYSKVGKHVHLVQYDVQSSDGAVGGLNYETSVRPSLSWNPYTSQLEPISKAEAHQEVVRYRWWADTELGMTYFHDHSFLKDSLKHGLFGAIVIEPANATYHDPDTGDPIYVADGDGKLTATTSIGGTTRADIKIAGEGGSHVSGFREFVPIFNDGFASSINLRNESLLNRIETDAGEAPFEVRWQDGKPFVAGGVETAFSSLLYGDPPTNTWRAIQGDDIRVRTEGGGLNEIHTLNLHNNSFRFEANNPMSTVRDFALVGVSEAFSFELGNQGLQAADYLYRSGGTTDVVNNGKWGLLRVNEGPEAGTQARGELRLELDSPTSVTIAADQVFYSMRGTEFVPEEAISISQEDVEKQVLQTSPRTYIVDLPIVAVRTTDEANLPARTPFATKPETLLFGNSETKIVKIENITPIEGGASPLFRLTGSDTDSSDDLAADTESEITIDADSGIDGLVWRSGDEESNDLTVVAEMGDILVFRQADESMPHGMDFADLSQVILLGETEADKPDAVLQELGDGESGVGTFVGPITGSEPEEFARFEVIREITDPIEFICSVHLSAMKGVIESDAPPPDPGPEITIDADSGIDGLVWRSGDEESNDLTVVAEVGDILVFRQADDSMPHGMDFADLSQVILLGETEADKPDAVLREMGEGESAVGEFVGPMTGDSPEEFARFEVIQDITAPIEFICSVHLSAMKGVIEGTSPIDDRAMLPPADEPADIPGAIEFHIAAVPVTVPDRSPEDGPINIDADSEGMSFLWRSGGDASNDLTVVAAEGDVIVFRQVDDVMPHGLRFTDTSQVILLGETEAEKPDALLRELGTGESAVDEVIGPTAGGNPEEFARFEVIREITAPIAFDCVVHLDGMKGRIEGAPASSSTDVAIDAGTAGGGLVWRSSGQESADLKVTAELGDVIVFRQADDTLIHGLGFTNSDQVRLIGETEAQKPDALLEELGDGASAVGAVIDPITSGAPAEEFARFEVIREITAPIDFFCVVHGNDMKGAFESPEENPGTEALVYMRLELGPETDLAETITAETRAGRSPDLLIGQLVEMLNARFTERPEPLVLRVTAGQPLGDGTSEPVDVVVRLTNLLPNPEGLSGTDSDVSMATSLHASLVSYDQQESDGTATGRNDHSLVVRGDSRNHHWIIDRPVGAARFADMADPSHQLDGLFGALIVEPHGSTIAPASPDDDGQGWQARVITDDPDQSYREFVLFLHDGWPDGSFAINYYSAIGHTDAPPTPRLRAHRNDQVVIREIHAAGQGGFTNLTFFAEPGRARLDIDDPRSNRIAAISNAPGAAFNWALSDLFPVDDGASDQTETFLYGSHVGSHLNGGMWGLFELLPTGDPMISPLDEGRTEMLAVAAGESRAASVSADAPTGNHHVVTATRNQWLYKGRRSGEGEAQALRIPVVPGDTIEFRQSDGDHGVFFYLTRMTDGSELGRSVDAGEAFDVVVGDIQLKPMPSQRFVSSNLASDIHSGKRDIVTIRFSETWDQPLYFGDPNTSTDARRKMFGALVPVTLSDEVPVPEPLATARLAAAAARSGPDMKVKMMAESVAAAPASLDLGALANVPEKSLVLRDGELRETSHSVAADVTSPLNDQWFRRLPTFDPKNRRWYQSLSVDLDRDGDLDVIAAIENEDNVTWQWWIFENNVADRPGLAEGDFLFKDVRSLSPRKMSASSGPDAFVAAADIDNDRQVDLLTYAGAGAKLMLHLNASATSSKRRLSFVQAAMDVDLGKLDGRRPDLVFSDDVDFDGWPDLVVSGGGQSQVFFNDAHGNFPSDDSIALPRSEDPIARVSVIERRVGRDRRFELALESDVGDTAFYAIDERRRLQHLH